MEQQKNIYTNNVWAIDEFFNPNTGKFSLMVYSDECSVVDYPIRYSANKYGWDWPERIPERIKKVAKTIIESDEKYQPIY